MIKINDLLCDISKSLSAVYLSKQVQMQHAWWILEYATGLSRLQLLCADSIDYDAIAEKIDHIIIQHVVHHKPLAYIIGTVPFCGSTILVEPPLLIPRIETEEWVENLINQLQPVQELLKEPLSILDMCSGSGCIAIALAQAFPAMQIVAVDIQPHAIELIKKNIDHLGIGNIKVVQSDLFNSMEQKPQFDIILSNPPYITPTEYQELDLSVKDWEDHTALVAQDDGLAIIKKIIETAPGYIRFNPLLKDYAIAQLIIEIGHMQATVVKTMMNNAGYKDVAVQKDFAQKDRIVMGRIDHVQDQQQTASVRGSAL